MLIHIFMLKNNKDIEIAIKEENIETCKNILFQDLNIPWHEIDSYKTETR